MLSILWPKISRQPRVVMLSAFATQYCGQISRHLTVLKCEHRRQAPPSYWFSTAWQLQVITEYQAFFLDFTMFKSNTFQPKKLHSKLLSHAICLRMITSISWIFEIKFGPIVHHTILWWKKIDALSFRTIFNLICVYYPLRQIQLT